MLTQACDVLGGQGSGQLQELVSKEQGGHGCVQPVGRRRITSLGQWPHRAQRLSWRKWEKPEQACSRGSHVTPGQRAQWYKHEVLLAGHESWRDTRNERLLAGTRAACRGAIVDRQGSFPSPPGTWMDRPLWRVISTHCLVSPGRHQSSLGSHRGNLWDPMRKHQAKTQARAI